MLELGPAVDDRLLLEEAVPLGTPAREGGQPPRCLVEAFQAEEVFGYPVELGSRLEPGPCRRAALHLPERMEGAPLHARCRPYGAPRLLKAAAAVAYHHVGRGDARHEGRPCLRALASGEVPAHDVVLRAGDEHDRLASEPDAVDMDDAVDLVAGRCDGPYSPEVLRRASKRAPCARHVGLARRREKPGEKALQAFRGSVHLVRCGRGARHALPSLRAFRRPAVTLHLAPAHRASFGSHA